MHLHLICQSKPLHNTQLKHVSNVQYKEEEVQNRSIASTSHNLLPVTSDKSRVNNVTPSVSESPLANLASG